MDVEANAVVDLGACLQVEDTSHWMVYGCGWFGELDGGVCPACGKFEFRARADQ